MNGGGSPWAVRIPLPHAWSAGGLRLRAGVLACEMDGALWLRGEFLSDELELELRKLPGGERYNVSAAPGGRTLTPRGARVPAGTLPAGPWAPLAEWLAPAAQPAALAGQVGQLASLRLQRTGREETASALVTSLAEWTGYACDAPVVRLRPLRFAACGDGRTLVHGTPLPPIAGRRYVERGGVAVPSGFVLAPALDPASLRALLGVGRGALALFDEDGSYERISADDFVAASRAAARATLDASPEPPTRPAHAEAPPDA